MTLDPSQHQTPLLTAHQVAEVLQLKLSSIYDAVQKGRLPAIRLWEGRRRSVIRFRATDIQEFINSRRTAVKRSDSKHNG